MPKYKRPPPKTKVPHDGQTRALIEFPKTTLDNLVLSLKRKYVKFQLVQEQKFRAVSVE